MRIDFVGSPTFKDKKAIVRVSPCIFKFEDGKLIIAGKDLWPIERTQKDTPDYPERPRDFTPTKENQVIIRIMKPAGFYDQD